MLVKEKKKMHFLTGLKELRGMSVIIRYMWETPTTIESEEDVPEEDINE